MNVARLRSVMGLAAAVVPCAIIVHLVAEAAAVGRDGLGLGFVLRHGYFAVLFAAAALWFRTTVGIGQASGERRRRCALLRADLVHARGSGNLVTLAAANLTFFALTQAVEGVPIGSGAFGLSLGIALSGSVAAALLVFFFGRSLIVAAIESVIGRSPRRRLSHLFAQVIRVAAPSRHATVAYSLAQPSRPPPIPSQF